MPLDSQTRLLRVLSNKEFYRVGGDKPIKVDVRIIAATHQNLSNLVSQKHFREDLFYRLNALSITVPPLRQRGDDILDMFNRLVETFAEDYGCAPPSVSAQEAAQLMQAPWPGNVRQLINLAERAVLQARRGEGKIASLLMSDANEVTSVVTTEGKPLKEYVEAFEKMLIDNTMRRHKGSIAKVMDELLLPRRTLNEKMAKYGLQPVRCLHQYLLIQRVL